MHSVLFIEREDRTRALLQCLLSADVKVKCAPCLEQACEKLTKRKFDLILWNTACIPAGEIDFGDAFKLLLNKGAGTRIVALGDLAALKSWQVYGDNLHIAYPPSDEEELMSLVECHLPVKSSDDQVADGNPVPIEFEGIVAVSLPMRAVIRRVLDAAAVDIPVLISGETGTGKDLVAAAIHRRSGRKNKPYVPVNMGAMPRELIASEIFGHERGAYTGAQDARSGIFEQGDGGTVFLDEIATMDERTQVSLLRVLEEKNLRRVGGMRSIGVDVRVIAATNEDLETLVAEKKFREDLFYRLNVFPIRVPPLRERISAITALTNHFVSRFGVVYGKDVERVSPETYRILRRYPWPGNVRELKNVIQAAVLMVQGKDLSPEFLPQRIRDAVGDREVRREPTCSFRVGTTLDGVESELIRMTLAHVRGNKKLAATILGISRRALYNKIKKHQVG
jgi:DNA-binding NtrC family response regulator